MRKQTLHEVGEAGDCDPLRSIDPLGWGEFRNSSVSGYHHHSQWKKMEIHISI
jgi:hypothetical protein